MISVTARRNALFLLFALPGATIASWVTRTPDIRDLLGASTAAMGLVLAGLSVGSMIGIIVSGPAVMRFGTRRMMFSGITLVSIGAAGIAIGASLGSEWIVSAGLASFGFGMGSGEVAMNIEGAAVERLLGRSTLPALHGFFSLGSVVGAAVGMVLTVLRVSVTSHLFVVALIVFVALLVGIRHVQPRTQQTERAAPIAQSEAPRAVWRDPRLLVIGFVVLALAMAEGTANDWLPLVMVDGHGMQAAVGSASYVVFVAAMTLGRFLGGAVVDRFGSARVLGASAVIGMTGILFVSLADSQGVAFAAVVLWGLGAALGFPVAISMAGDSGGDSAARVAFAATIGYVAFLVGPPLLGLMGELMGLRLALLPVSTLVAAAAAASLRLQGAVVGRSADST